MAKRDRDFEPGRVKNGGGLSRWLFSKVGVKSGRERLDDANADE